MSSRKRPASQTLLPFASAKQPRTTIRHPSDGGNASPSQMTGILSRWVSIGKDFVSLAYDTITLPFGSNKENRPALPLHAPSLKPVILDPPSRKTSTQKSRNRTPPPQSLPTPSSSASPPRKSDLTTHSDIVGPPPSQSTTLPASQATTQSSATCVSSHPRLDKASENAIKWSANGSTNGGARRKPRGREHIFAKSHKAKVQAQRENMINELFEHEQRKGYQSDIIAFKGYLNYKQYIELLERRNLLSPSPSLVDLRSATPAVASPRRHSFEVTTEFLTKALQKAKDALDSPKPPPAFHPTLEQLRLDRKRRDSEIENQLRPKRPPLPSSLPPSDEAFVDALFTKPGIVARVAKEQVTHQDISRLRPSQWLNDEIINFYGALILERAEKRSEPVAINGQTNGSVKGVKRKPLDAHYFSTFFWSKLKGDGYEKARLAKWTKKFDIFAKDVVLIPVNHNNSHWTAAAINFRKKRVESYDSLGMNRDNVFKLIRDYLDREHQNKKKEPFNFTGWEDYTPEDTPQQENGYDCGVFTCQFLESLACGDESFRFTQKNMPYLRRRMVWEIGKAALRGDS